MRTAAVYGASGLRRRDQTIAYARRVALTRSRKVDVATALTLITIAMWALNIPVSKVALGDWEPMSFSLVRFGLGGLLYAVWVLARERTLRIQRRDIPMFLAGGFIGIFLNQVGYMYALEQTTASTVVLIMATTPIWTALMARALGWEFVKPVFWVAIGVATLGVLLVLWGSGGSVEMSSITGDLLALLMAATWGSYSVIVRPLMDRYSPAHVSACMMLVGTVPLVVVGLPQLLDQDFATFTPSGWIGMGYALVGSLIIANLLWFYAIRRVGAAKTVAFMPLQPFLGIIFSALLLGETLDWRQGIGGVVIVGAILVATRAVVPLARAVDPAAAGLLE